MINKARKNKRDRLLKALEELTKATINKHESAEYNNLVDFINETLK